MCSAILGRKKRASMNNVKLLGSNLIYTYKQFNYPLKSNKTR